MNLYLVQHARPKSKEEDPDRPLSGQGVADMVKVGEFAARFCRISARHIFHSGKTRARQTADMLSQALNLPEPTPGDDLEPLAHPEPWISRLNEGEDDTMLVGHLPHLNKLASALLCGDPEANIIDFQMGGIAALRCKETFWSVHWIIVAPILPDFDGE